MDPGGGELSPLRLGLQDAGAPGASVGASEESERGRRPAGWFRSTRATAVTGLLLAALALGLSAAALQQRGAAPRRGAVGGLGRGGGSSSSRRPAAAAEAAAAAAAAAGPGPEELPPEAAAPAPEPPGAAGGAPVADADLRALRGGGHAARTCPKVAFTAVARDHGAAKRLPTSWGACALVGSGQLLRGAGLGNFIDLHATVIRMNRVTTSQYHKDLGRKATMYFKNTITDYNGTHVFVRYMGGHGNAGWWCSIAHGGCPFENVLWEGTLRKGYWRLNVPTAFPIGHQAHAFNLFQHNMKVLGHHDFSDPAERQNYWAMPSAGFKALLTALMACDSVTLFGFGGTGTVDHHHMGEHDFASEHRFESRLMKGDVSVADFPSNFHGSYAREFSTFRNRILCMSKHKLIAGTHR